MTGDDSVREQTSSSSGEPRPPGVSPGPRDDQAPAGQWPENRTLSDKPKSTPEEENENASDGEAGYRKPDVASEQLRSDNAVFQSWILRNQTELAKEKTKPSLDPEYMTAASMVKENENRKIIESPREYQVELFERAKQKNTIAVLPTGK